MKSHSTKKRLDKEARVSIAARLAREENSYLMALYDAFVPSTYTRHTPKFISDEYGNRIKNVKVSV